MRKIPIFLAAALLGATHVHAADNPFRPPMCGKTWVSFSAEDKTIVARRANILDLELVRNDRAIYGSITLSKARTGELSNMEIGAAYYFLSYEDARDLQFCLLGDEAVREAAVRAARRHSAKLGQ